MKIGVIMGGISSEREVSLNSGRSIVENLDTNKYEVVPVRLDKEMLYIANTGHVERRDY